MAPRRRRKRKSRIIVTVMAVVIGAAAAGGIYWYQNPGVQLTLPNGITDQVSGQRAPLQRVPESFTAITSTTTPEPLTRTARTAQTKERGESRDVLEKLARPLYEPKEERESRQRAETAANVTELERKVHAGINAARARNGSSPQLGWDDHLAAVARAHSKDMTERGYFSHDTPEGLGPSDRIARAGYSCWKGSHYGVAENIAIELAARDMDKVAAAAVQSWLDSPGHRTNLLDRQYDRTGIGASFGTWRGYSAAYLTQVFC